jgi:hypothetical protein
MAGIPPTQRAADPPDEPGPCRLPKPLVLIVAAVILWGCEPATALRPARDNLCFPIERVVLT